MKLIFFSARIRSSETFPVNLRKRATSGGTGVRFKKESTQKDSFLLGCSKLCYMGMKQIFWLYRSFGRVYPLVRSVGQVPTGFHPGLHIPLLTTRVMRLIKKSMT